jgi:GT2 family glycosyltransferase
MDLSVVIPTYNRRASLTRTLDGLRNQTLPRERYEVIVVDDGSRDGTWELLAQSDGIRAFRQSQNAGPAAARNVGVRNARGTWVLFLGDDTIPARDCLEVHLQAHGLTPLEQLAILGGVEWWEGSPVTPLMRYLTTGGTVQHFSFHAIRDPENVPFGFFFTANLSIGREFLCRNGLFDEEFRYAYGEDTELAYRLTARGLRIAYRPDARVAHDHPTTYAGATRRAQLAGRTEILVARKHPELVDLAFLSYPPKTRLAIRARRVWTTLLIDPFLRFADRRRWDHPRLRKLFDTTLANHQLWSMLDAHSTGDISSSAISDKRQS